MKHFLRKVIQLTINIPRWVDYAYWKQLGRYFRKLTRTRFVALTPPVTRETTFAEVMQDMQLAESDLVQRYQYFRRLAVFWIILWGLTVAYGCYLIINGVGLGVVVVLILSLLMLSQAFQYHFWAFQIIQRRLNCSLQEWWQFTFNQKAV
jgi:intracellular multiplication protein IcmV